MVKKFHVHISYEGVVLYVDEKYSITVSPA